MKIGNKEIALEIPSAYTLFEYVELFDSEYLDDLEKCRNMFNSILDLNIKNQKKAKQGKKEDPLDCKLYCETIRIALRLVYVMQDSIKGSFREFTKSIDGITNEGVSWINEVIQNGYLVFQRDLSESEQYKGDK